jgi:kinesin family protein 11
MLTRLLAESFGGSSKTCLIITVSTQGSDREETRCSLEFGKRAKLVKNQPEINLEVANDPSPVMQALVAKELGEVQRQREALLQERELLMAERARDQELLRETHSLLQEAATEAMRQQAQRASDVAELEEEKRVIHQKWIYAAESAAETQESSEALLRQLAQERTTLNHQLVQTLAEAAQQESEKAAERARYREADSALRKQLAERQQRAKEYNDHLAQLRQQVQQLRTEKATLQASFQVEEATLRSQWQDHVSRLEEQKAQMAAAFEEQQASLTAAAVDLLSNSVKDQGDRSFDLEEAEARARQVEQEGALRAARCTERKETVQQLGGGGR